MTGPRDFTKPIRLASKTKQSDNSLANTRAIFGILIPSNYESVDKRLNAVPHDPDLRRGRMSPDHRNLDPSQPMVRRQIQ
jgi:hypothetical protein